MPKRSKKITHIGAGFAPHPRSADRHTAIIHAAIEVLNEKGFDKASFEEIGKRCRMRRSHVAYYFRSKPDLLETVYRYVIKLDATSNTTVASSVCASDGYAFETFPLAPSVLSQKTVPSWTVSSLVLSDDTPLADYF